MELSDHTSVLQSSAIPEVEPLRLVATVGQGKRKFSETFKYGQVRLCKRADSQIWHAVYKHPRTGKVTQKVPDDFPAGDQPKMRP